LFETINLKAGPSSTNKESILFRKTTDSTGVLGPQTADYEFLISDTYGKNKKVYVVSDTPTACTVSAMMIQMTTYE